MHFIGVKHAHFCHTSREILEKRFSKTRSKIGTTAWKCQQKLVKRIILVVNRKKLMEQFSNFTFVKQLSPEELEGKFNMSYRIKVLLNERIDLSKYGNAIRHISFSPLIGEVFPPISEYMPTEKC